MMFIVRLNGGAISTEMRPLRSRPKAFRGLKLSFWKSGARLGPFWRCNIRVPAVRASRVLSCDFAGLRSSLRQGCGRGVAVVAWFKPVKMTVPVLPDLPELARSDLEGPNLDRPRESPKATFDSEKSRSRPNLAPRAGFTVHASKNGETSETHRTSCPPSLSPRPGCFIKPAGRFTSPMPPAGGIRLPNSTKF